MELKKKLNVTTIQDSDNIKVDFKPFDAMEQDSLENSNNDELLMKQTSSMINNDQDEILSNFDAHNILTTKNIEIEIIENSYAFCGGSKSEKSNPSIELEYNDLPGNTIKG